MKKWLGRFHIVQVGWGVSSINDVTHFRGVGGGVHRFVTICGNGIGGMFKIVMSRS